MYQATFAPAALALGRPRIEQRPPRMLEKAKQAERELRVGYQAGLEQGADCEAMVSVDVVAGAGEHRNQQQTRRTVVAAFLGLLLRSFI